MAVNIKDRLLRATRELFPTGRAFNMSQNGVAEALNRGLIRSENEAYLFAKGILDSILPDNDNFTAEDAGIWEIRLGMVFNPLATLDERKMAIERKLSHPGDILARQHYLYIEGQLQRAGFDIYCHEYVSGSLPANALLNDTVQHGDIRFGQAQHGQQLLNIVANYSDENRDKYFNVNDLRASFFIGGDTYPDKTDVPFQRKVEFRELILKLKPAHTPAFLLIDYI